MVTRAAAYIRVSDQRQDRDGTPATQRHAIEAYAAKRSVELGEDIEIVRWYTDVYTGGESYFDLARRDLQDLRHAISRGEYDLVLAYHPDRIARGTEVLTFWHECKHAQTRVETALKGPLAGDDSIGGKITLLIQGEGAGEERVKIMQRASDGMARRAKDGARVPGCRPRYGYAWDDPSAPAKGGAKTKTALVPDPSSAPIVRRIFLEFAAGQSLRSIAIGLDADGIPTPTQHAGRAKASTRWPWGSVQNILRDEMYTGRAVALRHHNEWIRNDEGRKRSVPKLNDASATVALPEGTVPALIDEETFAVAQERLATNRQMSVRNNPNPEATLLRGGFAVCGYCGHPLVTSNTSDGKARQYSCSSNTRRRHGCPQFAIRSSEIDSFVWGKVADVLRAPGTIIGELHRQMEADADPSDHDLATLDREIEHCDRQLGNLAAAMAKLDGAEAALAALAAQMKTLDSHRRQHAQDRAVVVARQAQTLEGWESAERFIESVESAQHDVDGYTYDEKREALLRFGVKAKVRLVGDGNRIDITARVDLDKLALGHRPQRVTAEWAIATEDRYGHLREGDEGDLVDATGRRSGRWSRGSTPSPARTSSSSASTAS